MSPEEMEKIPQKIEQMMYGLQQRIMEDVVRRIQIAGEITSTTDYLINKYRLLGGTAEFIESEIKRLTGLTDLEIQRIYEKVITEAYARNEGIYTKLNAEFIPYEENDELQILVSSIINQTKNELSNITGSMGFMVDYGVKKVFTPISEYYQKYLDNACMDIASGTYDYGSVLRRVVKQMTASGIRTVDYASGYSNRATVAARRAVMTGAHQLNAKINEQTAKELGTDTYEVTWHSGHRAEHWWGGKVFSYKELVSVCGLGTVTGLCGANCYHSYNAFIPGISVRTYSDQQLEEMEAREKIGRNWQGKSYNAYQATQKQRQMETQMRKYREDISLLKKSGGNAEDISASQARYINTLRQYREFSKRMELPEQMERVYIDGLGRVTGRGMAIKMNDTSGKYGGYNKALSLDGMLERNRVAHQLTEKYTTRKSKWSGNVISDDEKCKKARISGRKEWSCDILLLSKCQDRTIIHEHLHARSGSYLNPITYIPYAKMEEASVELLAREICIAEKIPFTPNGNGNVDVLYEINHLVGVCDNDLDFAQALFAKNLKNRYKWLVGKTEEFIANNVEHADKLRRLLKELKGSKL